APQPPSAPAPSPAAPAQPSQAAQPPPTEAASVAPIPPKPESHILDESGMFTSDVAKSLSARLLTSQTRTGLGIYLSIQTYLIDETPDVRASRTHEAWLEKQKMAGIVIVHDRSTGRLSFAGSDDKRLPDPDGLRALYRLADAAARKLPPEATGVDRIVATLSALADGLESWQKNGSLPALPALPATPTATAANAGAEAAMPTIYHTRPPWPKPKGFLVDEAEVLLEPGAAADLAKKLSDFHQSTGLSLYVITVTFPPSGLTQPLADKLAAEWLPEASGGILVYDRSQPGTLSFAGTPHVDRWMTPVQLKILHEGAQKAALATGEKPQLWLPAAASWLMEGYVREGLPILQEGQKWMPQSQRRILPWVLGGGVLCALLLYLIHRWQEGADRRRSTIFLFPEVYVPERLGAPQGGGTVAETSPGHAALPAPPQQHPNATVPTR
ncbi:MAG: hypothetical protein JWL81_2031, partial [Verrucomicrobiales bacterium]|nr:hypothetical protein [Verrucomicrobiales bacterium]